MWEALYKNIHSYVSINDEQFEICKTLSTLRRYRKKQYLLQEGDVARCISFVVSGITRSYEVDEEGREHILSFASEGWWIGDLNSFFNEVPGTMNIDCLEDCEVIQLSKAQREELFKLVPPMETFCRMLVESAAIDQQRRILNKLSKSATEQYHDFLQRYPQLEQRIPDHLIASYLGITPQSLSRIRSQQIK